jgi:hypothetical protein
LVHSRFLPHYDVIAKDYLFWVRPGAPTLAELSITVCAALSHLGRALAARSQAGE